jgi:hypothetical protein
MSSIYLESLASHFSISQSVKYPTVRFVRGKISNHKVDLRNQPETRPCTFICVTQICQVSLEKRHVGLPYGVIVCTVSGGKWWVCDLLALHSSLDPKQYVSFGMKI